jgi:FtsP/CotA-like multicopper oxidase with cupredoxin domain
MAPLIAPSCRTVNYLLNGNNVKSDLSGGKHALWSVKPGKKHLFRIIGSAAQNMFSVHFDHHKMTVIAADYVPIVPYTTEWLNIGIGQRYDVIVEMDQEVDAYFLRAVTQTGCPSSCDNNGLGVANGIILYEGAKPLLPTSTAGNKTASDFASCVDEPLASLVPFIKKPAGTIDQFAATASTLPAGNVARVDTSDDGTVFRWFLNNGALTVNYTEPTLQTLAQGRNLSHGTDPNTPHANAVTIIARNKWVYFIIANQFTASHPMHLHGHDMSILGQSSQPWDPSLASSLNFENPTRRDTIMLQGSETPGAPAGHTVIAFESDNPGAWLMHCHILWHADGGLALQWIERPQDMPAYGNKDAFKQECSSLVAWEGDEAEFPHRRHGSGSSGMKVKRAYMDAQLEAAKMGGGSSVVKPDNVVRHDVSSSRKRFLDRAVVKRGLGDGYKPRHVRP